MIKAILIFFWMVMWVNSNPMPTAEELQSYFAMGFAVLLFVELAEIKRVLKEKQQ